MTGKTEAIQLSRRALLAGGAAGAGALATPLLTGCDSSDGGSGPNGPKPTIPPLELEPEVEDGPVYKDGYVGPRARTKKPFGDGSTTFRVVVAQDSAVVGDWAKNEATAWFEERTGVKIEFQAVLTTGPDGGTDLTKINAMLSGGDLPDAFMGIPFTAAQISLYGQQGLFQPLDDLIEVYAPETRQAMKDYPDLRPLKASTDGNLYTMLGVNDCYHCRSSNGRAWINQKYLDKVGMEMPTTTDELREVLLEFKNSNPSGEDGFIPLASGTGGALDAFFMQPFLYSPGGDQNGGWLRLNNGKVEFTPVLDGWREALRYLAQLGADGLITPQNFSRTDTEMQTAGNKGQIGFARAYWWGSFFNPVTPEPDAAWRDYVPVLPLEGPAGTRTAQWDYYAFATDGLQITSACEHPEVLVQWSDYQMDLESIMRMDNGVRDDNWTWSKDGAEGIDGDQALWNRNQWPAPEGTSWSQYATMFRSLDYRHGQQVDPDVPTYEKGLYDASEAYQPFAQPKEMQLPPVIIGDENAAQAADTATAVEQHVTQSMAAFALGEKDINNDGEWQAYLDAFQAMNLQPYLDIHQQAYESRPR